MSPGASDDAQPTGRTPAGTGAPGPRQPEVGRKTQWLVDRVHQVKQLGPRLVQISKNPTQIGLGLMVLGIGAFVYDPPRPEATRDEILAIDQMIPHGYQLVPIELQNGSAVNAVVDHFGVVDLYLGEERVAESLKLIRSAMSSEQFSVLIPDGSVGHLLGREGPFRASLRRREASPPWVRPLVKSHKALADWDVQALEPEKTP